MTRGRPDFIPATVFRQYLSTTQLNKYFKVDGILAASYVSKCLLRTNRPIPSIKPDKLSAPRYRPLDVVARARGEGLAITRNSTDKLVFNVEQSKLKLSKLKREISELELKRDRLKHIATFDELSSNLTMRDMLIEDELVSESKPYDSSCGVYFLIANDKVVYVGQSVNVYGRVHTHKTEGHKKFDAYTYIPCKRDQLDVLESLYIHALAPTLQGRATWGNLTAPFSFEQLVSLGSREKYTKGISI